MNGPPVNGPPVTGPPVTGPPVTGPPVTGPPVTGRPVTGPTVRRRLSPPAITLVALALFLGAAAVLGLSASTGSAGSEQLTKSVPWLVWRVVAALALVVFLALFLSALRILRDGGKWGLAPPDRRIGRYLLASVLVVAIVAGLIAVAGGEPDIPVRWLAFRARAVLVAGLLTSVPWLALVWLAHAECRDLASAVQGDPGDASAVAITLAAVNERLLLLWKLLVSCVSAFAVTVVAAIVNSGALRASFLSAHPARAADFPAANVLFYGGFFAVVLAVIALPLVSSWRSCAFTVVERTFPLPADGLPTDDWFSARTRLEKLLHLDVPLLRNPLTALSIFVPLITAALAAFLPQLGTG